jgi:hypothetical protein
MNVLEQSLTENHENLIVDGPQISRAASETPRRVLTQLARRKHSALPALAFATFLAGLAVLVHFLRSETGDLPLPRNEFEGLGIVLCAFAYIGIFIWRLSRALQRDAQEVEASEKPLEIPAATARELNPGK